MADEMIDGKLEELKTAARDSWDSIPDIGLYMDQVIGYLNRRLDFLSEEDPLLTSSMVNNYVKAGVLSRPKQKRYTREQLAQLYMLCSLKQVLSIQDAADMLDELGAQRSTEELYRLLSELQHKVCEECATAIGDADNKREKEMVLALSLSLKAAICRAAAIRLIDDIRSEDAAERKARRKADKAAAKSVRTAAKAARAETKKSKAGKGTSRT